MGHLSALWHFILFSSSPTGLPQTRPFAPPPPPRPPLKHAYDASGIGHTLTIHSMGPINRPSYGAGAEQQEDEHRNSAAQFGSVALPVLANDVAQQDLPSLDGRGGGEGESCGGGQRGCKGSNRQQPKGVALSTASNWRTAKRLRTKSQPYLYAYMNPPGKREIQQGNVGGAFKAIDAVDELQRASGVVSRSPATPNAAPNFDPQASLLNSPNDSGQNGLLSGIGNEEKREVEREGEGGEQHSSNMEKGQQKEVEEEEEMTKSTQSQEEQSRPPADNQEEEEDKSTAADQQQQQFITPLPPNLRIYRQKRLLLNQRRENNSRRR